MAAPFLRMIRAYYLISSTDVAMCLFQLKCLLYKEDMINVYKFTFGMYMGVCQKSRPLMKKSVAVIL